MSKIVIGWTDLYRFPGIRLVEQTEQKFRRIGVCLEEKQTSRERPKSALYLSLKIVKGGPFGLCETPAGCKK